MAAAIGVLASPIMLAPPADDRRPGACLAQDWKARLVDVPARRGVAVPVLRPCRTALGHHKTDVTWDGRMQMIVLVGEKLGRCVDRREPFAGDQWRARWLDGTGAALQTLCFNVILTLGWAMGVT